MAAAYESQSLFTGHMAKGARQQRGNRRLGVKGGGKVRGLPTMIIQILTPRWIDWLGKYLYDHREENLSKNRKL